MMLRLEKLVKLSARSFSNIGYHTEPAFTICKLHRAEKNLKPYAAGIWFSLFKIGRITLENSAMERRKEDRMERDTEALRKELLDEACAGAFSGLGAMILDADEIQNADESKLEEIARRYGK